MPLHIVRLGSPRGAHEGPRLGTVRRPPRGMPKSEHASRDFYDAWLPELSPSEPLVKLALASSDAKTWSTFVRRFRAEMKEPAAAHLLDVLALLSRTSSLAIGCYCEDESRCHRSVLRALLEERGAKVG